MTDEERKKINFTKVPKEVVEKAVIKSLKWGFVPNAVSNIKGDKSKEEIFHALDFWYSLNKKLSKEDFAQNIILYNEGAHLLTPEQINVVREWANTSSQIVRKALENTKLRLYFNDELERLGKYIEFCEKAKNPSQMARTAINYEVDDCYRYKLLYDELKSIGLNVGTYNNWKHAANPNNHKN